MNAPTLVPPPPAKHFFRAEVLNFDWTFLDTNDISIMRGGSMLASSSMRGLADRLARDGWHIVEHTGASVLATQRKESSPELAEHIAWLKGESSDEEAPARAWLTIACALTTALPDESDVAAATRLASLVRVQQLQMPALTLCPSKTVASSPCVEDRLRPATRARHRGGQAEEALSEFSFIRWKLGKGSRQRFYGQEVGSEMGLTFTDDLHTLAAAPPEFAKHLKDKVALIHVDGDAFGSIRAACKTLDQVAFLNGAIKDGRRSFLIALLDRFKSNEAGAWQTTADPPACRLETLLWGGDEFELVVPGWLGLEVLAQFYEASAHWQVPHAPDTPLHHSAAIVFCGVKTPIASVRKLAGRLVDEVMKSRKTKNCVAYEVLESFDHIGSDLEGHRQRTRPPGWDFRTQLIPGPALRQFLSLGCSAKEHGIARGPLLHQYLDRFNAREALAKQSTRKFQNRLPESQQGTFEALLALTPSEDEVSPAAWLHLPLLWDYLIPEVARESVGARR